MKRYRMEIDSTDGYSPWVTDVEAEDGPYVRYDDAEAELASLRAANAELVEALKKIARGVDCPEGIIKRPDFYASQDYFEHIANEALSRAEQAKPETETCVWSEQSTSCNAEPSHSLIWFAAELTFCPFCGKKVEVRQ